MQDAVAVEVVGCSPRPVVARPRGGGEAEWQEGDPTVGGEAAYPNFFRFSSMNVRSDIESREREAREAQQEAQRAMELAHRTRAEFLSRMSHELRTPLNAVIGFTRVLESNRAGNQRPEDIEMLKRVRVGGERLLSLIEDIYRHVGG